MRSCPRTTAFMAGCAATAFWLAGCTSDKTASHISAIERGDSLDVASLYKDDIEDNGKDIELCLMEKGRIAQLQGDFEASRASFDEEVDRLRSRELDDNTLPGAQISVGSTLVNDNMLAYRARLFEVEMLRLFQCYNYLGKGNLEGAAVEIRNAEFIMDEAEKAREDVNFKDEDYRKSEAAVNRRMFENQKTNSSSAPQLAAVADTDAQPSETVETSPAESSRRGDYEQRSEQEYDRYFTGMADALAQTKSSVLNPYVVYVGGLIHEMAGEPDQAYISYKKGLEVMPSNPYLQRDVVRLARQLNATQDFDRFKTAYPEIWARYDSNPPSPKNGRLVVVYEDGWVPKKEEVFISLAAVAVAYPVYNFAWYDTHPLRVSDSNVELGLTSPVCRMDALAVRALKEEAKWRIIRQSARLAVKGGVFATGAAMTAVGNDGVKAAGIAVMIASAIYNNASEKADLRCWRTLPGNAQILVADLPPGNHKLDFAPQDAGGSIEETVPISAGQTTVVRVVRVGPRLIYQRLWPASN